MVHLGLDDQHIVQDGGHAEQVVVACRKVFVKPEVTRAGLLLRAVVNCVLNQLQADAALVGALLGMGREYDLQPVKPLALQHHLPQLSFNPVTRLNTGLVPATWSRRSATK